MQAAIINSGYGFPRRRVTVNLAPAAAAARSGPTFDLALACCVLAVQDEIDPARLTRVGLFAELGLGGDLRRCDCVGAAAEWYSGPWTVRAGLFDLSQAPNTAALDAKPDQYQEVGEVERRYSLGGHDGKIAVQGFATHGRMGRYADAIALALATGRPADIAAVRRYQTRLGLSANLEQALTDQLGLFVRVGEADGAGGATWSNSYGP